MRQRSRTSSVHDSSPHVPRPRGKSRGTSIADGLTFRRLTVDDLANVRHLHSLTCRCLAEHAGEDDVEEYLRIAASPEYADLLLSERHILAFCGDTLVGSAGWSFGPVGTPVARLASVFVHPLFTKLGIGRRLVQAVEADARGLGFERLEAPLPTHAGHFLRRLGFVAERGEGIVARAAPTLGLARRLVADAKGGGLRPRSGGRRALTVVGQD